MDRQILYVLLNLISYSICYQMMSPVLLEIIDNLTTDQTNYGYIKSITSLLQTIGGLFMGSLTDNYGSKFAMLISIGNAGLYYMIILSANSLMMIYLANIPQLFQHMFLSSQKYMADRVSKKDRAKYNGFLGLCYGIGMFLGPKIGGAAALISLKLTPFLSMGLSFLSFTFILFMVQDSRTKLKQDEINNKDQQQQLNGENRQEKSFNQIIKKFKFLLIHQSVRRILMVKAGIALGSGIFYATLNIFLKDTFNLNPSERGTILSIFGLVGALTQAFITPYISNNFKRPKLLSYAISLMLLGYIFLFFVKSEYQIIIGALPIVMGATIFQNFQSAELSNCVDQKDTGSILSLDMGLSSFYRIFTPTLGAFIFTEFGYQSMIIIILTFILSAFIGSLKIDITHHSHQDSFEQKNQKQESKQKMKIN